MRPSVGLMFVWTLLLCHSSAQVNASKDVVEESSRAQTCFQSMTKRAGNIDLFTLSLRPCTWFIHHENATTLHILFQTPQQKKPSDRDNFKYNVRVFTQKPIDSKFEADLWHSDEGNSVRTYQGPKLWLIIHRDNPRKFSKSSKSLFPLISYIAQTQGFSSSCKKSPSPSPHNGNFIQDGDFFGSTGELRCNEGFILRGGRGKFVCSVIENSLSWVSDGSFCDSICKHPFYVPHATFVLQIDSPTIPDTTHVKNTSDDAELPSNLPMIHTTVTYICQDPYIIQPEATLQCRSDKTGVPRWSAHPPSCTIPACSSITILENPSGAIVNPSYPSNHLIGGFQSCSWEIRALKDAIINLYFEYFDLPSSDDVRLVIFDAGATRPVQIAILTGTSKPTSIVSDTSKVIVTYHGPALDVFDHKGFYLKYEMVKSGISRLRRDASKTSEQNDGFYTDLSAQASLLSTKPSVDLSTFFSSSTPSAISFISSLESSVSTPLPSSDVSNDSTALPSPGSPAPSSSSLPVVSDSTMISSSELPVVPTSTVRPLSTNALINQQTREQVMTTPVPDLHIRVETNSTESTQNIFVSQGTTDETPKPTAAATNDDSNDDWKIAVGIVIPLILLISVLVGVYICYRKKYPVRMIIGREFGKFSNPDYARPRQVPTLVREDADDYFSRSSGNLSTEELNPVDNRIQFDNLAFVKDEGDEEEQERKFLERKSWLFRKNSSDGEVSSVKDSDEADESKIKKSKAKEATRSDSKVSTDTEIAEMLDEQKATPKPKRRVKKKTKAENIEASASQTCSDGKSSTSDASSSSPQEIIGKPPTGSTISLSSRVGDPVPDPQTILDKIDHGGESNYLKTAKIIFEQPSFEEVCAEIKARSRSMSVDMPRVQPRPRSFSVDPSKSARRGSLHDETIMAAHVRSLASYRKATATEELPNSPQLSASIVGVDIRRRSGSTYSSDSSLSHDDFKTETRDRGLTISSANSNPHLVTDLDESIEENSDNVPGNDSGQGVIHKTTKVSDLTMSDDNETNYDRLRTEANKDSNILNPDTVKYERTAQVRLHESDRGEDNEVTPTETTQAHQLSERKSSRTSSYSSKDDNDDENDLSYAVFSSLKMSHGEGDFQEKVADKSQQDDSKAERRAVDVRPEELVDSILSSVLPIQTGKDTGSISSGSPEDGKSFMRESKKSDTNQDQTEKSIQRLSSRSESGSSEDNAIKASTANEPFVSAVGISLSGNPKHEPPGDPDSLDSSKNKINVLTFGGKTQMDSEDNVSDDGHSDSKPNLDVIDSKMEDGSQHKRRLQFKLPEGEHSGSSSDTSSKVSSLDSGSGSSDEDMGQTSYDFMAAAEPQARESKDLGASSFGAYDLNPEHVAVLASTPSSVKHPAGADADWQEILPGQKDQSASQRKIISEIKLSDSSSDSFEIVRPRDMTSSIQIVRPEPHTTSESGQTSRLISIGRNDGNEVNSDVSEYDSDENFQITDADMAEILESSSDDEQGKKKNRRDSEESGPIGLSLTDDINFESKNKTVYTFREDNSEDEDVDV